MWSGAPERCTYVQPPRSKRYEPTRRGSPPEGLPDAATVVDIIWLPRNSMYAAIRQKLSVSASRSGRGCRFDSSPSLRKALVGNLRNHLSSIFHLNSKNARD